MNELTSSAETEDQFPREDIEAALARIVESAEFLKNRNSARFLKFIVEETMEGRGERLKAYSIATLALERDPDFDPQSNSIVRVQATRLRQLLQNYYSGPGANDPLRIVMPLGSYQPVFEPAPKAGEPPAKPPDAPATGTPAGTPPARPRRAFRAGIAAGGAAVAALALAGLWLAAGRNDTAPDPPATACHHDQGRRAAGAGACLHHAVSRARADPQAAGHRDRRRAARDPRG